MAISKMFVVSSLVALCVMYFQLSGLSEAQLADRVRGKRVVVTGASLGIGREIVKEYARLGAADIVIVARSENKLNSLRDEVYASVSVSQGQEQEQEQPPLPPTRIHVVPADLSSERACQEALDGAAQAMGGGGVDYLVLNHITNSQYGLWTENSNHDFVTNLMTVNTLSYIWLATQALPALQEAVGGGQVLVISSFAGWVGVPHTALYSASKHALRGFFNALRVELSLYQHSPVGVTVCTIGATDTEGTHGIQARISGVTWEHPRVVAAAIVASGAARDRELFFPWLLTLPTIVLHFFAPSLVEKLLHMTMH